MVSKRQQIVECMDYMVFGMVETEMTKDSIWQNKLIWWICKAVYLLLEDKLRKEDKNFGKKIKRETQADHLAGWQSLV